MKNDNFFFIGMPGVGKTTLGKMLAQHTQHMFIDADHFLMERMGVDIPTIFALEGEEGFRKREAAVIEELTGRNKIILATGGGAVINPVNRSFLSRRGTVIYLEATAETLLERIRPHKDRPLLQVDNPLKKLKSLIIERTPLYREIADYTISIENKSCHQLLQTLLPILEKK